MRNVGGVDINPALAGENETRLGRVGAGLQALFDLALNYDFLLLAPTRFSAILQLVLSATGIPSHHIEKPSQHHG